MTTFFNPVPRWRNCLKTSAALARQHVSRIKLKNQEIMMMSRE